VNEKPMSLDTAANTSEKNFKQSALQIVKGASWFSAAMVVGMVLEYATQAVIANQLGPTSFGIFSIGLQFFGIILVLSVLALPNALVYFLPGMQSQRDTQGTGELLSTSFWLYLLVCLVTVAVLFSAAGPIATLLSGEAELAMILRILALAVPGTALVLLQTGVLRGLKLTWQASVLAQFYERALRFLLIVILLWMGLGLTGVAWAYLLGSLVVAGLGIFHLRRYLHHFVSARPTVQRANQLLHYSGPLFLSQLLSHARASVQPLILAYFMDAKSVGIYVGALLFVRAFALVLATFNFFYVPVVSEASAAGDMSRVRRLYRLVTGWSLILVLPTCLLIMLFPQSFLGLLGEEYLAGSWVLRITMVGVIVNIGVGAVGATLLATGKTRTYLNIELFGTVVSLSSGLLLIWTMGFIGAAVAQVTTSILWNVCTLLVVYKLYRMQPFSRHYIAIFGAALASVLLVYPITWLWGEHSLVVVLGMIPLSTALSVAVLLKFHLLDGDSQSVASELWTRTRTRLIPVQAHLFNILK
jgi:O-antigen/teichoic acid export membrane protein